MPRPEWQDWLDAYTGGPSKPFELWTPQRRAQELAKASANQETILSFLLSLKAFPWGIVHYANTCIDTFNPRLSGIKHVPYLPDLRQAEFLLHARWCIKTEKDKVTLKSRYVGGSWSEMIVDTYGHLFETGYQVIVGSYDEDLVEGKAGTKDTHTLLGKFDYILDHLPPILRLPPEYDGTPFRVVRRRENPINHNSITGDAMTADFGAASRTTRLFYDELSRCKVEKAAWESGGQTTSSRHAVFTPQGKDFAWSLAYPDEESARTGKEHVERPEVFRIHWKDTYRLNEFFIYDIHGGLLATGHGYGPDDVIPLGMGYDDGAGRIVRESERRPYDRMPDGGVRIVWPWYEQQRRRYDDVGAARELDINFEGSVAGKVYSVQMSLAKKEAQIARDPDFPLYLGLDPGRSVGNAAFIVWVQFNWTTGLYEVIREYTNLGRSARFYVPLVTGQMRHLELLDREAPSPKDYEFFEEMRHPAWRINDGYGDPYIENKGATNDSWKSIFTEAQIPLRASFGKLAKPAERIECAKNVILASVFATQQVPKLLTALGSIRYPAESPNSNSVTATQGYVHHPIYSHPCAALEYFAVHDPHRYDRRDILEDAGTAVNGADDYRTSTPLDRFDKDPRTHRYGDGGIYGRADAGTRDRSGY